MASADLTLSLLADAGELKHTAKKRKRGDTTDDTRNILNLHLLMCQPTSNLGTPIELAPEEVKAHQVQIGSVQSYPTRRLADYMDFVMRFWTRKVLDRRCLL